LSGPVVPAVGARGDGGAFAVGAAFVLAVLFAVHAFVSPTNFSGWDEWLVIDLTSRGTLALPYENRPLSLVFNWPGSLLLPATLRGYWLAHGLYLGFTGVLVSLLARRLAPGEPRVAYLAGALAVTWAPLDFMRLDTVLLANYSGLTLCALVGALLLLEGARRRKPALGLAGAAAGFAAIRGVESTAAVVLASPLLLWLDGAVSRAERRRQALVFWIVTGCAVALAALPLLPGQPGSYQVSGLGFDPHPGRALLRLARQVGFQLLPLLGVPPRQTLGVPSLLAAGGFVAGWLVLRRGSPPEGPPTRALVRLALVGLGLAILGHAVMALSGAITTPARTQILSAPGAGLLLAAALAGTARLLGGRRGPALTATLGAVVVALGAGRTMGLQAEWDRASLWPAQSGTLGQLVREAPRLREGTLVVLLDEAGAFPASFTFRHALLYLYGDGVTGTVWGAEPFLYPVYPVPEGFLSRPYPMIRGPWRAGERLHRPEEVAVFRLDGKGRLALVPEWPPALPPLPAGAAYAPRRRIEPGPGRPEQALVAGAVERR
jgi:hypothetical protein